MRPLSPDLIYTRREDDVTKTLYKDTLKISAPEETLSTETAAQNANIWSGDATSDKQSKVNRICDAFLSVLSGRIDTNLQNLVTAHVCKSPPDLDSGLRLVATLRGMWIIWYITHESPAEYLPLLMQNETQNKQKKPSSICASLPMLIDYLTTPWDCTTLSLR